MLAVALTWQRMMSREFFVATIDAAVSYLFSWSSSQVSRGCARGLASAGRPASSSISCCGAAVLAPASTRHFSKARL